MISNTVHMAILQPRALRGIVRYVKMTDGNLATPDPAYAYRPPASDRRDDVMTVACEVWRRTLQVAADRSIESDKEMVGRRRGPQRFRRQTQGTTKTTTNQGLKAKYRPPRASLKHTIYT